MIDLTDYMNSLINPKSFDNANPESEMHKVDAEFEKACAVLEESGINEPKKLTVYEWESRILYLEKKYKKK
jgi:hypothetical protein